MPTSSSPDAAELRAPSVEPLLGYLLALAEVPTRQVFQRRVGAPLDLRPVEFTLLALLHDNPQAGPSRIGAALRLPLPHVTALVDRLAARGLVARVPDPQDGRAVQVRLTPRGRSLARRALRSAASMEQALLAVLTPAEQARLRALLLKFVRRTVDGGAAALSRARGRSGRDGTRSAACSRTSGAAPPAGRGTSRRRG